MFPLFLSRKSQYVPYIFDPRSGNFQPLALLWQIAALSVCGSPLQASHCLFGQAAEYQVPVERRSNIPGRRNTTFGLLKLSCTALTMNHCGFYWSPCISSFVCTSLKHSDLVFHHICVPYRFISRPLNGPSLNQCSFQWPDRHFAMHSTLQHLEDLSTYIMSSLTIWILQILKFCIQNWLKVELATRQNITLVTDLHYRLQQDLSLQSHLRRMPKPDGCMIQMEALKMSHLHFDSFECTLWILNPAQRVESCKRKVVHHRSHRGALEAWKPDLVCASMTDMKGNRSTTSLDFQLTV